MSIGRFLVIGNVACVIAEFADAIFGHIYWLLGFVILNAFMAYMLLSENAWNE